MLCPFFLSENANVDLEKHQTMNLKKALKYMKKVIELKTGGEIQELEMIKTKEIPMNLRKALKYKKKVIKSKTEGEIQDLEMIKTKEIPIRVENKESV